MEVRVLIMLPTGAEACHGSLYEPAPPGTEGGALLTPLIVTSADRITVNARVNGELKIRILDQDDQPLPGFGWSDFNVLRGDSFSHPAQWNGDFSALKGTPIKLEFSLVDGQLYGFDLTTVQEPASFLPPAQPDGEERDVVTESRCARRRGRLCANHG